MTTAVGIRGLQIPGDFNTRILVLVDGATVNEAWGPFAGVGFGTRRSRSTTSRASRSSAARCRRCTAPTRSSASSTSSRAARPRRRARGAGSASTRSRRRRDRRVRDRRRRQAAARLGAAMLNRVGESARRCPSSATPLDADGDHAPITAGIVGAYDGSFAQIRAFRRAPRLAVRAVRRDRDRRPRQPNYNTQLLVEGGHTRELSQAAHRDRRAATSTATASTTSSSTNDGDRHVRRQRRRAPSAPRLRGRYDLLAEDKLGITAGAEASYNATESRVVRRAATRTPAAGRRSTSTSRASTPRSTARRTEWLAFTAGVRFDRNSELDDRVSPRAALFLSKDDQLRPQAALRRGLPQPERVRGLLRGRHRLHRQPRHRRRDHPQLRGAWCGAGRRAASTARSRASTGTPRDIVEQAPSITGRADAAAVPERRALCHSTGVEVEASYRDSAAGTRSAAATFANVEGRDDGDAEEGAQRPETRRRRGGVVATPGRPRPPVDRAARTSARDRRAIRWSTAAANVRCERWRSTPPDVARPRRHHRRAQPPRQPRAGAGARATTTAAAEIRPTSFHPRRGAGGLCARRL